MFISNFNDLWYYGWATEEKLRNYVYAGRNYDRETGRGYRRIARSNFVIQCYGHGHSAVRMYNTDIYQVWEDGARKVTSGGWHSSVSTRKAIDVVTRGRVQFAQPAYAKRALVKDDWFVVVGSKVCPYAGGDIVFEADGSIRGLETHTMARVTDEAKRKQALAAKREVMRLARPTLAMLVAASNAPVAWGGPRRPPVDTLDEDQNIAAEWWSAGGVGLRMAPVEAVERMFSTWLFGAKNEHLYDDYDVYTYEPREVTPELCAELGLRG